MAALSSKFLQNFWPICNFNIILLIDFHIIWVLEIKSLRMKLVRSSFTYLQSLSISDFCKHRLIISQSAPLNDHTSTILEYGLLSVKMGPAWLSVFPPGDVKCIHKFCDVDSCRQSLLFWPRFLGFLVMWRNEINGNLTKGTDMASK